MPLTFGSSPPTQARIVAILSGADLTLATITASASTGLVLKADDGTTVATFGIQPSARVQFAQAVDVTGALSNTSTSGIQTLQAAGQDAVKLLGRAGGVSAYALTLTPAALTGNRIATFQDASYTVAGIDLSNPWSAQQVFAAGTAAAPSFGIRSDTGFYAYTVNSIGASCAGSTASVITNNGQLWQYFGVTSGSGVINQLVGYRGTESAPSPVLAGDLLGRIQFGGYYDASASGTGSGLDGNQAFIDSVAYADWTAGSAATPVRLRFYVSGLTGGAAFAGQVNPGPAWNFGLASDTLTGWSGSTLTPIVQVIGGTLPNQSILSLARFDTGATECPEIIGARARAAPFTYTAVVSGSHLFRLAAEGADGTDFARAGSIVCMTDGTVAANQVPGRWEFYTANSSGTETLALTLSSTQKASFANAINLASIAAPTTAGDIARESGQDATYSFTNGIGGWFDRCIYSQYASVTQSGIVTAQSLASATAKGTRTLPANFFKQGKVLKFRLCGVYTTDAAPGNATIAIKIGTTTIRTTASFALDASVTGGYWILDGEFSCQTTGGTGTISGQAAWVHAQATPPTGAPLYAEPMSTTGAVTFNTTAAGAFDVVWTADDAGTAITCSCFRLWEVA